MAKLSARSHPGRHLDKFDNLTNGGAWCATGGVSSLLSAGLIWSPRCEASVDCFRDCSCLKLWSAGPGQMRGRSRSKSKQKSKLSLELDWW